MNTLWPLGQGTVRQIQQQLARSRPRAYTTIMTIMDRLAHKGVVSRHKVGRAYVYRPNLSAQEARAHALEQVVEGFFEGSADALAKHIAGGAGVRAGGRARRAPAARPAPVKIPSRVAASGETTSPAPPERLDESLL